MKIAIKNLGAIKQAEFTLGDLTIICGSNNTGKTYVTYAVFGFLSFWREVVSIKVKEAEVNQLLNDGVVELNIQPYLDDAQQTLERGCVLFTEKLSRVFAASVEHFKESEFSVALGEAGIQPVSQFKRTLGAAKTQLLSILKKENSATVSISLIVEKESVKVPVELIGQIIADVLKEIVYSDVFPTPFIASAERTGAAIFRKELDFARNRLLEEMNSIEKEINPFELLAKVYSDYALPVKSNVDFTRQLEGLVKKESFIAKNHPDILTDFAHIIGGKYVVTKNDELYYIPKGQRVKLTMEESSSAVRSLLDIGFYLRHVAQPGDLLMIDEPELNLHPENQRRVTRLLSRLVNMGIKVFITTHSDYIVKELNTLIMLKQEKTYLKTIAAAEGYKQDELMSPDKVRVYIAEEQLMMLDGAKRRKRCLTLVAAEISPELGIDARSFDKTINEMNRVQEEIMWGEDE
ncbi:MAG: ATP-binding protein [Gammaproteobacteria bacterium]|nr:ATP-binding protein [Gammaproteobacteria bacterium]